jgi:MYXO-CTERM domain-containing protein
VEDLFCGGRQGATARSVRIGSLSNSVEYQVAVIAYDDFDNPSVLSNVDCETPQPVVDFYEAYRRAGGRAGGGLCAVAPGAAGPGPLPAALLALALVGAARRRPR